MIFGKSHSERTKHATTLQKKNNNLIPQISSADCHGSVQKIDLL